MLSLLCDRCKRLIDPNKDSTYLKITRRGNIRDGGNGVDLCDSCYELFEKWLKEGKENEE